MRAINWPTPFLLSLLLLAVPGGWVKYRASESDSEVTYVMELIAHGTGAKSELGVR